MNPSPPVCQTSPSTVDVSFIIPARNEESSIETTVCAITKYFPPQLTCEIIVVDNESTDRTQSVACNAGADHVLVVPGPVGSIRNAGVKIANGRFVVFLDADVSITLEWGEALVPVLRELEKNKRVIAGSWVSVSEKASWIEESWFRPLEKIEHGHMNSAHMLMRRDYFLELGGFSETLVSGEDSDLSERASSNGARLRDVRKLRAIHRGYPKTLGAFFRRELWHGAGDFDSVSRFARSKVALVSVAMSAILFVGVPVFGYTWGADAALLLFLTYCIGVVLVTLRVYHHSSCKAFTINCFLMSIYLLARSLAWLPMKKGFRTSRTEGPDRCHQEPNADRR